MSLCCCYLLSSSCKSSLAARHTTNSEVHYCLYQSLCSFGNFLFVDSHSFHIGSNSTYCFLFNTDSLPGYLFLYLYLAGAVDRSCSLCSCLSHRPLRNREVLSSRSLSLSYLFLLSAQHTYALPSPRNCLDSTSHVHRSSYGCHGVHHCYCSYHHVYSTSHLSDSGHESCTRACSPLVDLSSHLFHFHDCLYCGHLCLHLLFGLE